MIRLAAIPAMIALAACAPQRPAPAPEAAAPAPTGPVALLKEANVIEVKAPIADQDALAPLHCTAALKAIETGASALEWVGGIAKPANGGGFDATMAYETTFDKRLRAPKEGVEPADGGLVSAQSWMTYCDEAGIPRAGEA